MRTQLIAKTSNERASCWLLQTTIRGRWIPTINVSLFCLVREARDKHTIRISFVAAAVENFVPVPVSFCKLSQDISCLQFQRYFQILLQNRAWILLAFHLLHSDCQEQLPNQGKSCLANLSDVSSPPNLTQEKKVIFCDFAMPDTKETFQSGSLTSAVGQANKETRFRLCQMTKHQQGFHSV